MKTPRAGPAHAAWGFWWFWLLASAVGSGIGLSVAALVFLLLGFSHDSDAPGGAGTLQGVAGTALGAGVGSAQLLVLRRHFEGAGAWAWGLAVSYGIGFALTGLFQESSFYRAIGPALLALAGGLLQWLLILRGRVSSSAWWLPLSVVAFYCGLAATVGIQQPLASTLGLSEASYLGQSVGGVAFALVIGALIGAIFGLITGTALVVLLGRGRQRKGGA